MRMKHRKTHSRRSRIATSRQTTYKASSYYCGMPEWENSPIARRPTRLETTSTRLTSQAPSSKMNDAYAASLHPGGGGGTEPTRHRSLTVLHMNWFEPFNNVAQRCLLQRATARTSFGDGSSLRIADKTSRGIRFRYDVFSATDTVGSCVKFGIVPQAGSPRALSAEGPGDPCTRGSGDMFR